MYYKFPKKNAQCICWRAVKFSKILKTPTSTQIQPLNVTFSQNSRHSSPGGVSQEQSRGSTRIPKSFSGRTIFLSASLKLYWCLSLLLPRCRTLHFPLINFIFTLFSNLFRSLWMTIHSYLVYQSFLPVPPLNLLRVQSVPFSRPLMKTLNSTGPTIDRLTTTEITAATSSKPRKLSKTNCVVSEFYT